jgi:CIC family chloride channel protein
VRGRVKSISDLLILRDPVLPPVSVSLDESLSEALIKFLDTGFGRIPIEDEETGVVGMLWLEDLLARYRLELQTLRTNETRTK